MPCCRSFLLALVAGVSTPAALADFLAYPDGPLNPRVPVIAPVKDSAGGWALPFQTEFGYRLQPGVSFAPGGELSLLLRDDLWRAEKRVLQLDGEALSLRLIISPASAGRVLQAQVLEGERVVLAARLKRPESGWSRLRLSWGEKTLVLEQDGVRAGELALPRALAPVTLRVRSGQVADLRLAGEGELRLNWSEGYAATVAPRGMGAAMRVLGCDTRVISLDAGKRDCPYVQVVNAAGAEREVSVRFALKGEVSGVEKQWEQKLQAPPRGEVLAPIALPAAPASDVYHLSVDCEGLSFHERRHFLYVQRRGEAAGPGKFGLHDSGAKQFGYWPDALPVDVAHVYASWAYIQGPPWTKDFGGEWGIDPKLPPEEWNWNPRLDWMIAEGRRAYVSLLATPFQDWQRGRRYDESRMVKYAWGWRGGAPDDAGYRRFLRAFAQRYRGKIWACEVENEPNTPHGYEPADYAQIAKAVYEELKAADSQVRVLGICGTSTFVGWMRQVLQAGGAAWMDGVSWHTYVTPFTPEESDLAGLLASARKAMQESKPGLTALNSETGTYVALREKVDEPMAPARLAGLIEEGVQPLAVLKGWPSRAMGEREAGSSVVANAVTNFLAGAECFVFFGWNLDWPKSSKWWNVPFDDSNFGMFSASREGERTPSEFTLAAGVLMAQLEPAEVQGGREVRGYSLRGGIFPKRGGGEVAVVWSPAGRQTIAVETTQERFETVSLLGRSEMREGKPSAKGRWTALVEIGREPLYVHSRGGLRVGPPVVQSASAEPSLEGTKINVTFSNPFSESWQTEVRCVAGAPWQSVSRPQALKLAPQEKAALSLNVQAAAGTRPGKYALGLSFTYPGGEAGAATVEAPLLSSFNIASLPAGMTLAGMRQWRPGGGELALDRPEQVVAGRAPAMASLQEKQYWAGAAELSAKVKVGANEAGLSVFVEVQDAHPALPKNWPSVAGSCVELFFDFRRPGQGLGTIPYGREVHQLVIRPVLQEGAEAAVWKASVGSVDLPGAVVESGRIDASHYWVAIRIPRAALGGMGKVMGFDVGINGAKESGDGRKSQLMLFGTANNNRDASRFGVGFLPR